jgi:hypothetical protein
MCVCIYKYMDNLSMFHRVLLSSLGRPELGTWLCNPAGLEPVIFLLQPPKCGYYRCGSSHPAFFFFFFFFGDRVSLCFPDWLQTVILLPQPPEFLGTTDRHHCTQLLAVYEHYIVLFNLSQTYHLSFL